MPLHPGGVNTLHSRRCAACPAAGKAALTAAAAGGVPPAEEPDDVAEERARVEGLNDYEAHPIVVRQLNKTYPGLDGQPPKVRGWWVGWGCGVVECETLGRRQVEGVGGGGFAG